MKTKKHKLTKKSANVRHKKAYDFLPSDSFVKPLSGIVIIVLLIGSIGVGAVWLRKSTQAAEFPTSRDPYKWPFSATSIWNMPVHNNAEYVHATIKTADDGLTGMTTDEDVIVMRPNAPRTDLHYNDDGWKKGLTNGRCSTSGRLLDSVLIPHDFTFPGSNGNSTPNAGYAILKADGRTVVQGQPFAKCSTGSKATTKHSHEDAFSDAIYDIKTGDGILGSHGGSKMSALGGSIRYGELTRAAGPIRHALKINVWGLENLYRCTSESQRPQTFRWPAKQSDGNACDTGSANGRYNGSNPNTVMGSLLALKPDYNINQLETEPAKRIAQALKDYGGYIVDNTAWDVYAFSFEVGPDGDAVHQFKNEWGFEFSGRNDNGSTNAQWDRDVDRIFLSLHVINNNSPATIGGGATADFANRRAPKAPCFVGESSCSVSPKKGDVNGDFSVNASDLAIVLANYGKASQTLSTGDVNSDGWVNALDLSMVVSNYGS